MGNLIKEQNKKKYHTYRRKYQICIPEVRTEGEEELEEYS